jgi:hypothetical protein
MITINSKSRFTAALTLITKIKYYFYFPMRLPKLLILLMKRWGIVVLGSVQNHLLPFNIIKDKEGILALGWDEVREQLGDRLGDELGDRLGDRLGAPVINVVCLLNVLL